MKWQKFSAWFSLLALGVALISLLHAERLKHSIEHRFVQLRQELFAHMKHQRDEIQASLDTQQSTLDQLRQQGNPKERTKLEIHMLMQEAKFYWEFTQDAASTTRFFDLAIDKLAQEVDPESQTLRQQLRDDRQLLQQVTTPSHQALINQLEQLSHQVLSLNQTAASSRSSSSSGSFWQQLINVHTVNSGINPDDTHSLQQQLLLKLSLAKTAVIQQNTSAYQQALTDALSLWKKIAPNTSEGQAISNSLEQLSRITLRTDLPIKSWSSKP